MNQDSPIDHRSAIESSLTALLLGELPHEEAAALHQKLAQDAELAKLYERLKQTINLVRETISSPAAQTAGQPTPLKLSDQRRQKLLQQFKTVAPKEFAPPRRRAMPWLVPVGIAAALVALLAATLLPALSKAKSRSMGHSFGTWSLSEPDAPALAASAVTDDSSEHARLAKAYPKRVTPLTGLPKQSGEGQPPTEVSERAKFAGPAIVLPNATELADAASTPAAVEGAKPWSAGATLNGFYDDSSTRARGAAVGNTLSGSGGSMVITAGASDGSQPAFATTDFSVGLPMPTGAAASPNTVASSRDSEHMKEGNAITRYAYSVGQGSVATPTAPMAVPPPVAAVAPADSLEVAKAPMQAHSTDTTAGDLLLKRDAPVVDNANKLADATTSARSLDRFGVDEALITAPKSAPATPLGGPYYGGGAYSGYSAIQPASSLGGRGGTPDRPVLRSPKEGGIAGTSGGTAITPAPTGPQETAVKGLSRRYGGIASSLEPAKARILAQGGTASSDTGRSSTEAAGEVLGVQPPEVKLKGKLAETKQDNQKALGFDWYLGNSLKNQDSIKAQGGTAPSQSAGNSAGKSDIGVATARADNDNYYQLHYDASAQPGLANSDGDKVPMLGELPAVGRLFRGRPEPARGGVNANAGAFTTGQTKDENATWSAGRMVFDTDGVSQGARSPIVLPSATPETSLALKLGGGKDVQLLASANQPGAAPVALGESVRQMTEDVAKT